MTFSDLVPNLPPPPAPYVAPPWQRLPRTRWIMRLVIAGLAVLLAVAIGGIAYFLLELDKASTLIEDQEHQLEEKQKLIDQKVTFNAAMRDLMSTVHGFDGVLLGEVVTMDEYEGYAQQAWAHRDNVDSLNRDITTVRSAIDDLTTQLADAKAAATTNSSGTAYETVSDKFGAGFVTTLIDDADTICQTDVLACVLSADPYTVHIDATDSAAPYMTDVLRTGIAYHEMAHVLQMTNKDLTEIALEAFDGDGETMADCFALTYLPDWKLDHKIWVNSYTYWQISVGYGYTCNDTQRQVVRDWFDQLAFHVRPISQ